MNRDVARAKAFIKDFLLRRLVPSELKPKLGMLRSRGEELAYDAPVVGKELRRRSLEKLESAPTQVNIEVTSICNAKCVMCPRHLMDRQQEVMPFEIFMKTVREARDLGVKRFCLNGYGEIFTAKKHYKEFIRYVLDLVPDARIIINTNSSLMNEEAARFLIESKVDTVHCDIDGATAETFEKIRENLHYDMVVGNVKRLIRLREEMGAALPKVRVGMIRQPLNEHEVEAFRKQWEGVADFLGTDFMVSRGGAIEVQEQRTGHPCWLAWTELNVWSDGSVVLCCDDWNAHEVMGNVKAQSVREIWNGEKWRRYRELHAQGKAGQIDLCSKCNWSRPGPKWFEQALKERLP